MIMVRIYITESSKLLTKILQVLKKEVPVRGVSVFRAISGFGDSGTHGTSLLDLSLDLPLTVEFFDEKETIDLALLELNKFVKPYHIIFWQINVNK